MTVAYTIDPAGGLISQRRSGATSYYLYDQLGSARKLLDSSQATTDSYSYYAFGEVRSSSGSTTNLFKFVGRLGYYDDPSTDFQYLRARYYAPGYGRFLTPDRLHSAYDAFVYVQNSPVGYVDPDGHGKKRPEPEYWGLRVSYRCGDPAPRWRWFHHLPLGEIIFHYWHTVWCHGCRLDCDMGCDTLLSRLPPELQIDKLVDVCKCMCDVEYERCARPGNRTINFQWWFTWATPGRWGFDHPQQHHPCDPSWAGSRTS